MSEMVENAAKAIWEARRAYANAQGIDLELWGDGSIPKANGILEEARAAIEAMREPTSMMIGAAMIQPHPSVSESGGIIQQGEAAVRIDWQAMIDEALR